MIFLFIYFIQVIFNCSDSLMWTCVLECISHISRRQASNYLVDSRCELSSQPRSTTTAATPAATAVDDIYIITFDITLVTVAVSASVGFEATLSVTHVLLARCPAN